MTNQEIKIFNILSKKLCNELSKNDKCAYCPFYQWDTYYNCFNEDEFEFPLNEDELEEAFKNA